MPYHQRMRIEIDLKRVAGPALLLLGWVLILVSVAAVTSTAGRWILMVIGLLGELAGVIFFGRSRRAAALSGAHD